MTMRMTKLAVMGAMLALASLPGIAQVETPAPADAAQEEAFLDVLPKVEIPDDVQPIPGAVNEEFRNCRSAWPEDYKLAQSGQEARALRDIYGLVQAQNVIKNRDCTCAGKVANWQAVETIAATLRKELGVEVLSWQQTKKVAVEADRLTAIAETMCGGSF
jgi:hypothetical protein